MDTNTLLERELVKTQLGEFGLDPSLVLYLPLHQLNGSSFMSRDAFGHIATVTGTTYGSTGRTLDGLGGSIGLGDILNLTFPFTLEVWFKSNSISTAQNIVAKIKGAAPWHGYEIRIGTSKLVGSIVTTTTDKTIIGSTTLLSNTWYHGVFTYDGSNENLYVYAVSDATPLAYTTQLDAWGAALYVGRRDETSPQWFNGTIGEVRIYNRALSATEVNQNYLGTKWRYV